MSMLGKHIRTIHVDKPNDIEVPDPVKAPAFEINIPDEIKSKPTIKERIKHALVG